MSLDKFTIKYIIPDDLRDLHVDGSYVSYTPDKKINLHFFSERRPIPQTTVHAMDENGILLKNPETTLGCDIVRSIQTSVAMDLQTAKIVKDLLNDTINNLEAGDGES